MNDVLEAGISSIVRIEIYRGTCAFLVRSVQDGQDEQQKGLRRNI